MYMWNIVHHKNENIISLATTWTDLEGTVLSEIRQTEKDTFCVITLLCGSFAKPHKTHRNRDRI